MTRTPHDRDDPTASEPLPDALRLRLRLRGLRRDVPPTRDLWPDLSARLAALPQPITTSAPPLRTTPHRRRRGLRHVAWIATAASVAFAIGIGWQLRPAAVPSPTDLAASRPMLVRQADAMTREYDAAVRELEAAAPATRRADALHQLDRSAAEVRAALARDPDAAFLLEQLQRVYAQRLSLTRRLA